MKIPRRLIVNPNENSVMAVTFVSLSVFILAYSHILGSFTILIFFALWLPLPLIGPARASRIAGPVLLLLLLPVFACVSALWSDFPYLSLRAGLQYLSLGVCAAIAATYISVRSMAWGLMLGCHAVNLWSLVSGYTVYDYFGYSYAFAGLFPSKNTFGFFASLGVLSTCVAVLLSMRHRLAQVIALAAAPLFIYALMISESATSLVSLMGAMAALAAALVVQRLSRAFRMGLMLAPLVALPAIAIIASIMEADDFASLMGRDTTLTGRTDLWLAGLSVFSDAPILGVGYQAFWQPGVPLAEQLWRDFYILNTVGFHFHNTYIGVLADLGIMGMAFFLLPLGSALIGAIRQIHRGDDNRVGAIGLSFVILLLIRSIAEIDVFSAYTIGTFLFFYFGVLPWRHAVEARHLNRLRYGAIRADLPREWAVDGRTSSLSIGDTGGRGHLAHR